jgi:hypothetical protein
VLIYAGKELNQRRMSTLAWAAKKQIILKNRLLAIKGYSIKNELN